MSQANRQSSVKTVSESVEAKQKVAMKESKPLISPIEKSFRKIAQGQGEKGFGIIDRQTLQVCLCYRDSIKYSLFALGGVFIASVIN